jgi:GTPase SAR1 family protein
MSEKGRIIRYFAGGNTPKGFYSYYNQVLTQGEAKHIFCIKGGPGTGKSSFMKKIGADIIDRGYDIENLHCSSDPDSLDGVLIKNTNIAIFDATAPHVIDPKNPGAVDEILNFGEFWDEASLKDNKQEIVKVNAEIGKLFSRAYRYLKAAKPIYDETCLIYREAMNILGIYRETQRIFIKELAQKPVRNSLGRVRKLFAGAITPKGLINHLDTLRDISKNIYEIKDMYGIAGDTVFPKIVNETVQRGIDVDVFYCPIEPDNKIEHILIPELELFITTTNSYHSVTIESRNVIDLGQYLNSAVISRYKDVLEYNKTIFNELLNKSIKTIEKAKQQHDLLEEYYIPCMNFKGIDEYREKTLEKIIRLIEQ